MFATLLVFQSLVPIHTNGQNLVTPDGKAIFLRGVNFGSWFVEEIWMTPWKNKESETVPETIKDHDSLWNTIEKRLGKDSMTRIKTAWRNNWITEEDFRRVKAMGLNHVRLPILHDLIDEPGGMDRLKSAIAMAKKAGLYVVLDMHGAPGGQSNEHHTGKENRNRLWFDVENITEMERKWTTLASTFRNDPTVAVYDIMNEPMGAPNPAMLHLVYNRIIKAIRRVDPTKVLLVDDGYKGFETTPHLNIPGWTNVAYSLHFYNFEAKTPDDHLTRREKDDIKLKELQGYRNAPVYIGEFQLEPQYSAKGTRDFVNELAKQGWSWASWTWKATGANATVGDWGLYRPAKFESADPFHDSESELIRKIKTYRTENWFAPKENIEALTIK
jgi:endoglucanase